jgi:hypothetical protein
MKFKFLFLSLFSVIFVNVLAQDYVSFAGLSIGPGYKNSYELTVTDFYTNSY